VKSHRLAKARGLKVYGETCPQYLFLTADDLDRPGFEGAKYMCSPPPRDKANQEAIWQGLTTGVFDVFSSDHAGYRYDDPEGKMKHGRNAPFKKVANGVPGLAVRTALLFSEGVGKGRLDLPKFVALTATNAAKLYGLHPRKGTIAVGSDADLAIWDPDREVTIRQSMIHDAMDQDHQRLADHHAGARRGRRRGRRVCRCRRQGPVIEVRHFARDGAARAAHHPVRSGNGIS